MIRVLHCVNNMHRAGLETMIMNYYRNIDRNQIQFDFLVHRLAPFFALLYLMREKIRLEQRADKERDF